MLLAWTLIVSYTKPKTLWTLRTLRTIRVPCEPTLEPFLFLKLD